MTRRLPPLAALRAFEAAARHESFSRAAAEMGVTHGAISRQVQALEAYVGEALFQRSHGRVRLTDGGAVYARRLRGHLDSLVGVFDTPPPPRGARLVIAGRPDVIHGWLSPRIGRFEIDGVHPRVTIVAEDALKDFPPEADCVITSLEMPDAGVAREVLATNWIFPVAAPSVWQAEGGAESRYLAPDVLTRLPLIHHKDTSEWGRVAEALGVENVRLDHGIFLHHQSAVLEAATSGEGIAMADETTVRTHLESGRLRLALPIRLLDPLPYAVAFRREELAQQPVLQRLRDWLRAEGQAHRAWFDAFWAEHPDCLSGTAPAAAIGPPAAGGGDSA